MKTMIGQRRHHLPASLRWPLILLIGASVLLMISLPVILVVGPVVSVPAHHGKTFLAEASISQALLANRQTISQALQPDVAKANSRHSHAEDLDPTNLIENPPLFNSRPCVAHPSVETCDGIYPSVPPNISFALANSFGASACFDKNSTTPEYLPLDPMNTIATIEIWHFPTCDAWSTQIIFAIPAKQIQDVSIEVDQETTNGFIQWWNTVNNLPPTVTAWQTSTPKPFNQLSPGEQDFYLNNGMYSPLLYSVGAPIASVIRLDLTGDRHYDDQTPFVQG